MKLQPAISPGAAKIGARCSQALALLCLVGVADVALADGSGSLTTKAGTIQFSHAYAFSRKHEQIANADIITVIFSDKTIDTAKADRARDRLSELRSQTQNANWVEVDILPFGSVESVSWVVNGRGDTALAFGKNSGWYKIDFTHSEDFRHIDGSFRSTHEKDKKSSRPYFDLSFALNLQGTPSVATQPPSLGADLPADGAEPFAAYRAYSAAMSKGEFESMLKFVTKEVAAGFRGGLLSQRNDPNYKLIFDTYKNSAMRDPVFDKGYVDGDKATLMVHGKDGNGADLQTDVDMRKEDGTWRFVGESPHVH